MALNPNELFSTATGQTPTRTIAHRVGTKVFASGSGTLAVNAPVAFNTSTGFWVPWDADGSNGAALLKGLVFPDPIVLDSDEEVIGQVLLEGIVHLDDVQAATSELDADILAELQAEARLLGIHVQGAAGVR
jgi:hypothetical protein